MSLKLNELTDVYIQKNLNRSMKAVDKFWPEAKADPNSLYFNEKVSYTATKAEYFCINKKTLNHLIFLRSQHWR